MVSGAIFLAALAATTPLSDAQQRDIRCVAVLAIVASEQQRRIEGADAYPPLAEQGGRYAQVIGEQVMKQTGRTREQVRDAILGAVAAEQKAATASGTQRSIARADVEGCIARMREAAPVPEAPSLPQCAAMLKLAYDEVRARDGLTSDAKDLATLASVLDYRAREMLRGEGLSSADVDVRMSSEREEIAAEAKARVADGVPAGLDYEPCITLAKP